MGLPRCLQLSHRVSFICMIILTSTFFLVEIIVGYATNSMALVADSFHMLSDVVSLLVGFIALRYSKAGKQTGRYTFGWARAEVLGALVNAVFLVALCFSILVEALKRIVVTERIDNSRLVLITGGIGLLVNLIGLFLFHQHGHSHGGHGHSHGGGGHSHGGGGHSHGSSGDGIDNRHECKRKRKNVSSDKGHSHKHKHSENHEHQDSEAPLVATQQQEEDSISKSNEDTYEVVIESSKSLVEDSLDLTVIGNNAETIPSVEVASKTSSQLNIRGVYLHVLGDALGSVIVMISAVIIMFEDGKWTEYVDPGMSIILVLIILKTSIPLLKESSMILMQTVPTHLKIQEMQDRLIDQIPGVVSIHEFHIWQLAGSKIIASAHVRCKTLADYMAIANQLKEFFHNEGIHSTTIQPEFVEHIGLSDAELADDEIIQDCILECDSNCAPGMCCSNNTVDQHSTPTNRKNAATRSNLNKEGSRKKDTKLDLAQHPISHGMIS